MKNPSEVQLAVDQSRVGSELPIDVRRGDTTRSISVQPAELPRQQ